MSGQGSGGGGALVLLLVIWVVAVFVVVSRLGDQPAEPIAASPSAEPSPTPDLTFGITCSTSTECEEPVTRAETAGALDAALDLAPTTDNPFVDDDDDEREPAINRVFAAGLMRGCTDSEFCPADGTTRGQLAAILVRAFEIPSGGPDAFNDDDGTQFESAINAIAAAGFSAGCGERRFCPDAPVSRQTLRDLLARVAPFAPDASASAAATP